MRVKVFAIDQVTGEEKLTAADVELSSLFPADEIDADEQEAHARDEIERAGRVWIGGGAAQLNLVMPVIR